MRAIGFLSFGFLAALAVLVPGCGGSAIGNPVPPPSMVSVQLEASASLAVSSFSMCATRVRFVPAVSSAGPTDLAPALVEIALDPYSTATAGQAALAQGTYSSVEVSLNPVCGSSSSIRLRNASGDLSSFESIDVHFQGPFVIDSMSRRVVLGMQPVIDRLATVSSGAQIKPAAESAAGKASSPSALVAASCSLADVQAKVDEARSGATVQVPAGSCSWTTALAVPSSKAITLSGAGMASTVITGSGGSLLDLGQSGSRVTGFGFVEGRIDVDGDDWRIDHCRFTSASGMFDGIRVTGNRETIHPRGVIDHNELRNADIYVIGWIGLAAHALWNQPLALGSSQMVFIEDNVFTATQNTLAASGNFGARIVFRYNTVTDTMVEIDSVQGGNRGTRSWEIDDNTFIQSVLAMWTPVFIRGGTGVVFGNTVAGTWSQPAITFDNQRSFQSVSTAGLCNGSNPWDGNQQANGWPCRDQVGRSVDSSLWTGSSPYPSQASDAAYLWNNLVNGSPMGVVIHNGTGAWIQSGRDYFNGTVRAGYSPYAYPHPLTKR